MSEFTGKLYGIALSQPARSCLFLIREAGLDVEFQSVDILGGEQKREPFISINPAGKIPAYVEGDFKLAESAAIMQYLCESRGLTTWYPTDPKDRAIVNQWMHWHHLGSRKGSIFVMAPAVFGGTAQPEKFTAELTFLEARLGISKFVASTEHPTIADLLILPELDQMLPECLDLFDFAPFPNIIRYIADMKAALPISYTENFNAAAAIAAVIKK